MQETHRPPLTLFVFPAGDNPQEPGADVGGTSSKEQIFLQLPHQGPCPVQGGLRRLPRVKKRDPGKKGALFPHKHTFTPRHFPSQKKSKEYDIKKIKSRQCTHHCRPVQLRLHVINTCTHIRTYSTHITIESPAPVARAGHAKIEDIIISILTYIISCLKMS